MAWQRCNAGISITSDGQLVADVQSGDLAAFGHLVRRHAPMAKRMAVLWGAGADADDVVQDAFVKAYAALPRFRADGEFRAWLLTIVRNETRNTFRSRGRRSAREELAQLDPTSFTLDPEAQALTAVRRDELLAQVRALPVELREVVACRYLLELSEAETATALQLPAGTVKSRLHRALGILRKEVTDA
jgi:RNA polymerase sigma-70 factor (ECF subfamily)